MKNNQAKKLTPPEWQSPSTITLSADLPLPADKQKSPKYETQYGDLWRSIPVAENSAALQVVHKHFEHQRAVVIHANSKADRYLTQNCSQRSNIYNKKKCYQSA